MDADFDLSRMDDIPDVLPAADRGAPSPTPAPRESTLVAGPSRADLRRRRALAMAVSLAWLAGHIVLGQQIDQQRYEVVVRVGSGERACEHPCIWQVIARADRDDLH
jgi:hypothetical protein